MARLSRKEWNAIHRMEDLASEAVSGMNQDDYEAEFAEMFATVNKILFPRGRPAITQSKGGQS